MWRLTGYDSFAREDYEIGLYATEADAMAAAGVEFTKLQETQPPKTSGGPGGLQDRLYIVAPDGSRRQAVFTQPERG